MRLVIVLPFMLAIASAGATILVDDFRPIDASQNRSIGGFRNYGIHSFVDAFAGSVLGGERDLELRTLDTGPTQAGIAFARFGETAGRERYQIGMESLSSLSGTPIMVSLQYDGVGDEEGNIGLDHTLNPMGEGRPLFTTDVAGIRVFYDAVGNPTTVETHMILRRQSQILADVRRDESSSGLGSMLEYRFAETDLQLADSLTFTAKFSASFGASRFFGLDRIETIVPEPTSLLALGVSLAWLGLRKGRKG